MRSQFVTLYVKCFQSIRTSKEYQDCLIVATEGKYFKQPYGWPFPKFSPFLDIFNFYISEFIEKGSWDAITNKYAPKPQICPDNSGKPIDFSNCFTAFLILISGTVLALLLFGLEFATKPFDHMFDGIRKKLGDAGKSFSEALILVSTNPQYDDRLFIELQVQYMTILEHGENMLCT